MKYPISLFIICLLTIITSCSPVDISSLECQELLDEDVEEISKKVDPFLASLLPEITPEDEMGHLKNLELFVDMLQDECSGIVFELECYACIKTFPPMSEIKMTTVDGLIRYIDILTPSDKALSFVGIHE